MASDRRMTWGLTGRIVRVTLAVGAITVLTASVVAIVGASRLASAQIAAGDKSALQLVQDEVVGRFSSVETLSSRVSEYVASEPDPATLDTRLSPVYEASTDVADGIVVADRNGSVITAFPASLETRGKLAVSAFKDALQGVTGFRRVATPNGGWELWMSRAALTHAGRPVIVLIKTDTHFLEPLLATQDDRVLNRSISILSADVLIASNTPTGTINQNSIRYTPVTSGGGEVSAALASGRPEVGYYSDIKGLEGIDWRLTVLEPSDTILASTITSVAPTIIVLLIGSVLGIVAALYVSRRMSRPLMELEATAYQAATGTYVRPLRTDGSDEIGQVAQAFNAVALRLNALHDLSKLLASSSQLDQVLDGILGAMDHIVGSGISTIYLLSADERTLTPVRSHGVKSAHPAPVSAAGEGWLAQCLRGGEAVVHDSDVATVAANLPGLAHGQTVALVVPLISGAESLGVIAVLRDAHSPVSDAELEMVRTFSAQAAVAVHNSRLFEAETESLRVAEALRAVAERLVRPGGLESALGDVVAVVADLFGAEHALFAVHDRVTLGLPPAADRALEMTLLSMGALAFEACGYRACLLTAADGQEQADLLERLGAVELILAPVAAQTDHGAVLAVALAQPGATADDLALADAVANEVALAFDNAYLYERALSRAANLETVFRISQAVGSSLQVNVVLNRVLDVVQKILSADAVVLMTYDTRKRTISTAMARGALPAEFVSLEISPGEDVPGYVFSTGEPAAFSDIAEQTAGVAGGAARHGLRSMLAVPLLARGRSIGVLMVFANDPGIFSDEDLNVLQTFASQASLALDTARLYSREHEVASILQQSILPDALPSFTEIDAASVYQPAGADAEIGGDYYDLFRAPDGAIWFAIADVCGKGVVAATKTSMIKYSVRAFVAAGFSPSAVLGEVNRIVTEAGDPSDIVTLWVGRLDTDQARLSYANGGHPPAIVRHADGEFSMGQPTGPLLGALAEVVYGEETVELGPDDIVVLYTDGVTEARSGKEFFGEDRVLESVRTGGSADEISRRLLTLVRRWVHGELRDDVAILTIALRSTSGEHESARKGGSGI